MPRLSLHASCKTKHTPAGEIPVEWGHVRFGDIATFRNGLNFLASDSGERIKVVGVGDFQKRFRISFAGLETVQVGESVNEADLLEDGDLLFVRSNGSKDLIGRCLLIDNVSERVSFSGFTIRGRLQQNKILPVFAGLYFQSGGAKGAISVAGGGTNISNLSQAILSQLPIPIPPVAEQQKIADILGTWDEALEKLDALISAKERRKQTLMQQLLTGQRRLPGYSMRWPNQRFVELMRSEDRYVTFDDDHLYHLVSARRRAEGVFFREALYGRDIKTKVMKQVRSGDFLISRMQVVHGGLGVVPPECDLYYASDSYEVLVPRDPEKLSTRYINHLCRTRRFWHHALVCSHGVHIEKMTFVMADFEHEKFLIPEFAEQVAIADFLDTADAELRLLDQQRTALDQQKRGLMQQLLTGKVRVSI